MRVFMLLLMLIATAVSAQESGTEEEPLEAEAGAEPLAAEGAGEGIRNMLGMSILGNEEAPKSLVIVPWKSSRIGDGLGVSDSMDDRPRPVDREVFLREVRYYELRSGASE